MRNRIQSWIDVRSHRSRSAGSCSEGRKPLTVGWARSLRWRSNKARLWITELRAQLAWVRSGHRRIKPWHAIVAFPWALVDAQRHGARASHWTRHQPARRARAYIQTSKAIPTPRNRRWHRNLHSDLDSIRTAKWPRNHIPVARAAPGRTMCQRWVRGTALW